MSFCVAAAVVLSSSSLIATVSCLAVSAAANSCTITHIILHRNVSIAEQLWKFFGHELLDSQQLLQQLDCEILQQTNCS